MNVELKYSKESISFELNECNYGGTVLPNSVEVDKTGVDEVVRALQNPSGTPRLRDLVSHSDKIVIVTSDITRPVPSHIILPPVIQELKEGGASEDNIAVVLALGSHRPHTSQEKEALVGSQVYNSRVTVMDSDMDRCINLGVCRNGTPADIFEPVALADKIICIGNIEYHYFAGYSGGAKALMPGVSSWDAIQANHSNMVKPGAHAGEMNNNPVRQDIDQIIDFIDIDFIVNVVLDDHKEIIKAVSGHVIEAHREGCAFLDRLYKIKIDRKADIVVLSPGGYPKDINIYQAQKGLDNARHAVRDGGIIIWCASAKEGFGEHNFEEWMRTKEPAQMVKDIKENFILGAHKAAAISMVLLNSDIFLVSDLPDDLVKEINLTPFNTAQEALDEALSRLGKDSQVLIMPVAGSTLPYSE